jgi:hypothetical protein
MSTVAVLKAHAHERVSFGACSGKTLLPVELSSTCAVNSPHSFGQEVPEDPNVHRPTEKDLTNVNAWAQKLDALVVFYDAVYDPGQDAVKDFDIELSCGLKGAQGLTWSQVSGPNSGQLSNANTSDATFSNPKVGGLYRFDLNLFQKQKVGTQALLPLAGADMFWWLYHEAVSMATWAPAFKQQVENDNYSSIPGMTTLNVLNTWIKISASEFDYTLEPVNADKSAPCLAFEPPIGSGGGVVGALYGYVTVHGVVVHGSKINNMFWGLFGRFWGYSTSDLLAGADVNQLQRSLTFDNSSSQAAIQLGGHMYDLLENQGVSTLLQEINTNDVWKPLVDPNALIEEKLWPSPDPYDEGNSTLIRPTLSTTTR